MNRAVAGLACRSCTLEVRMSAFLEKEKHLADRIAENLCCQSASLSSYVDDTGHAGEIGCLGEHLCEENIVHIH